MKSKKILFMIILIMCIILPISFNQQVFAIDEDEENDDYEKYSEEYKEYLNLTDEEKKNIYALPEKYDLSAEEFFETYKDEGIDYVGAYDTATDSNTIFNLAATAATDASISSIPSSYSLITNRGIKINVEDQGSEGLCWAFASLGALRTHLAVKDSSFNKTTPNFSEWHMNYLTSNLYSKGSNREPGSGGSFSIALKYYKYNDGPIQESTLPYETKINEKSASELKRLDDMKQYIYVHETIKFPTITKKRQSNGTTKIYNGITEISQSEMKEIRNTIKKHIMNNGGVYCVIRINKNFRGSGLGSPYNTYSSKYSQYDDGSISSADCGSHAITIIGWDDNYNKNNFYAKNSQGQLVHPSSNGAYLILNSYGDDSYENGYQWISYEDAAVESGLYGYISASKTSNYYTYKFDNEKVYKKLKSSLSNKAGEFIASDSTKTIKVQDVLINEMTGTLDLSDWGLTDADASVIFKYEFPKITRILLNNNSLTKIPAIKCPKLEYLNASNNQISDISQIASIKESITNLQLVNNKIKNVSIISQCSKLTVLALSNNNIEDVSALKLNSYNTVYLKNQSISKTITNKLQLAYPQIFKEAKKSSSKLYGGKTFEFHYCNEATDRSGITATNPKAGTVYVKIMDGAAMGTKMTIDVQDTVPPSLTVSGMPTQYVKSATLKIVASDNCTGTAAILVNGRNIAISQESAEYKVEENGTYTIKAIDKAGNPTTKDIKIDKIDNTAPELTVTGNTDNWTENNITLKIKASDTGIGLGNVKVNDEIIALQNGEATYTVKTNGTYTVTAFDKLQNKIQKTIVVNKIDKTNPKLEVEGLTNNWTNKNITLTIKASDSESGLDKVKVNDNEVTITNGTGTYTISANGTYNVIATDKSGKESKKELKVSVIDKEKPTLDVSGYQTKNITKDDMKITIKTVDTGSGLDKVKVNNEEIKITNGTGTYTIKQNGTYKINSKDKAGNYIEKEIVIDNIYKGKPTLEVTKAKKGREVILNIKVTENKVGIKALKVNDTNVYISGNQATYAVNENGTYIITVVDNIGNEVKKEIIVDELYKMGDINQNGKIDSNDLLRVYQYIYLQRTDKNKDRWDLTEEQQKMADVNKDGKIDQRDILKIKRYLAATKSDEISKNHPDWLEI